MSKKIQIYFTFLITLFYFGNCNIYAQKGENLIDYKELKSIKTNKKYGSIKHIENSHFEIETAVHPQFIHNAATAFPIKKQAVNSGRVFLLSFSAKTTKSSLETGEAKVNVLLKQSNSYKNNQVSTQSISSNWKTYYVPFEANINVSKKDLAIVLHYGYKPQAFEIKDIKFEIFPKNTKLTELPKTKIVYKGMEKDAEWRKKALARIEAIRKGNFTLLITKDGKPVANKNIRITLQKHNFPFGGAISAKDILNKPAKYKKFKETFNHIVLENDLKIKAWNWTKRRAITLKALDIIKADNYKVKGHVLIWPGFNYLTKEIKEKADNPSEVKEIVRNHVNSILDGTKGVVSHWDVVNEAYTNKDLQRITGSEEILFDGFRILKQKQPNVGAFTNEYGIISKGGLDTKKQEWYYNFIKRIDSTTNGLLDGIGIQSHIGSDLTPPEKVLELLGYYATLGKQISISEFTMDIQEPKIREQYTKDFMIAALSHPNVTEFLFWGFVKDERKKVDIFNEDFTVGAMGKAYFSLVDDEWKTKITKKSNSDGLLDGRGFYGKYKYTFTDKGKLISGVFTIDRSKKNLIKIEL